MSKLKFWVSSIKDMPDQVKKVNKRRKIWLVVFILYFFFTLFVAGVSITEIFDKEISSVLLFWVFGVGMVYIQPHMLVWYKKCLMLFFVINIFAVIPLFLCAFVSFYIGGFSLIIDLILFITGKPLLYKAEVKDILDKISE